MARRIPPFAAIRAFEAAARHENLQGAADELSVSPSAVSHQVKALEAYVGTKLFLRCPTGLQITQRGKQYLQTLSRAFDLVEVGTIDVSRPRDLREIRLNTYLSLAQQWLIPLLPEFKEAHPDVSVSMITLEEELSFSGSDIDLAIRALEEPPKGCKSDLLLADQSVPVCSLDYLQREGPIQSPEDLVRHKLIAYNGAPTEWPFWLASHGVGCPELDYSLTFDTRTGTLQAACEGLGVAISRGPFADFMIERGHLLVPISAPVSAGMSYYLLTAERSWSIPSVKLFRRWLLSTCRRRSTAAYRQVEVAV